MNTDKSQPRQAATLAVVRDAPTGLEVLLLQRADKGDHNSLAWVFPGGLVDAGDRLAHAHSAGLDDAAASARLGLAAGGLDLYLAAIRESFEEAGLLFADSAEGQGSAGGLSFKLHGTQALAGSRGALREGHQSLAEVCRQFGLRLRPDLLHYIAHWLTPRGRAKRFDTRFFVAVLPEGQASMHDDVETVQQVWLRPAQALAAENTRRLMTPTRAVLEQLAAFVDTTALLAWARSPREVARVLPRLATGGTGPCPILPGHPAWDEVGRLDPEGRGDAWCEARPDVPVALAAGVLRCTAAATGGHSYLVECEPGAWAVIDPGPPDAAHLAGLVAALPGSLRCICLTDSDAAQAQAAAELARRNGVPVLGPAAGRAPPGALLRAWPGPAAGHACYLRSEDGMLFAGTQHLPTAWLAGHAVEWLAPRRGFLMAAFPVAEPTR